MRRTRCEHISSGPAPERWGNRPAACGYLKNLSAALQADGENEVRGHGLKHQKEKRSMDHFAGLDVSVKETSIEIRATDDREPVITSNGTMYSVSLFQIARIRSVARARAGMELAS